MECGSCTVCCRLLYLPELNKPLGVMCDHCTGIGCGIYEERPQVCRDFRCAYHQAETVNLALRPDHCGVLFEKLTDDIMFGLVDPEAEHHPHLNGQITSFMKEGLNVVIADLHDPNPKIYHQDDADPAKILARVVKFTEVA